MSGASANSCGIRSPHLSGFHQRDEGDPRSNLGPCLLTASVPEFGYARGFYVWSPDSGVLPATSTLQRRHLCLVAHLSQRTQTLQDDWLSPLPARRQAVLQYAHVPCGETSPLIGRRSQGVGSSASTVEGSPFLLPSNPPACGKRARWPVVPRASTGD